MPTTRIGDHEIHYKEYGPEDAAPLVLIHGLMGDWTSVVDLAEKLGERYRVIMPDMISHGRSDHPEQFTLGPGGR